MKIFDQEELSVERDPDDEHEAEFDSLSCRTVISTGDENGTYLKSNVILYIQIISSLYIQ